MKRNQLGSLGACALRSAIKAQRTTNGPGINWKVIFQAIPKWSSLQGGHSCFCSSEISDLSRQIMNASTRRFFVIAIVLTLCPHGISARGFNRTYLTRVKESVLQVNHSDTITELVSKALSIMREERPANFRVLYHDRFQDTVNSLNPYTMAISGIIIFQFREEMKIQQLLFPAPGKTFLILFSPATIIPRIFQKIQRERIASHFVIWLIVLKNGNDLEEVLLGLEGKMEDGTQVVLLIGESVTVCRFFSSQLDFNGKVRFFDRGTWDLTDPRSKPRLPRVLMPNLVDQYSNFNGRELAVGINNNLPFTMKSRVTDQGKVLPPSGIDFSMIDTLKAELNFTYRVVSPADGQWGGPLPNGTVTGLVGLVYRKETNFACSAVAIIGPREQVVDFSYPYYIDSLSLVSRAPRLISRAFAVFSSFPMEVWLCLIAVTLGIGPCLKIVSKFEESISGGEGQPSENISLQSFSFNTFRNLVLQGSMIDTKFLSLRLPFAFWYIFCLLIWALYSGTLTAVLAIPSYEKPIDSLADLPRAIREGFTIGTVKQTMIEYLLKDATEGIYKQTWNLLRLKDPSETLLENPVIGFNKILPSKFVFIAPTAVSVVAAATRGMENFHLGRHTFYPINYGIACPTGSPMKDKFSQLQARMVEGGLINKWENDEFYKVLKRSDDNTSSTQPAISLIHLQAAFFLLAIGYVAAAVVLMAENINDCLKHRDEKRSL